MRQRHFLNLNFYVMLVNFAKQHTIKRCAAQQNMPRVQKCACFVFGASENLQWNFRNFPDLRAVLNSYDFWQASSSAMTKFSFLTGFFFLCVCAHQKLLTCSTWSNIQQLFFMWARKKARCLLKRNLNIVCALFKRNLNMMC